MIAEEDLDIRECIIDVTEPAVKKPKKKSAISC